jgi:hypothetical protein
MRLLLPHPSLLCSQPLAMKYSNKIKLTSLLNVTSPKLAQQRLKYLHRLAYHRVTIIFEKNHQYRNVNERERYITLGCLLSLFLSKLIEVGTKHNFCKKLNTNQGNLGSKRLDLCLPDLVKVMIKKERASCTA